MKRSKLLKKQELICAYHEAGHAIEHVTQNLPFKKVTILPTSGSLGSVDYKLPNSKNLTEPEKNKILDKLSVISVMGAVAECIYTGEMNLQGSNNDRLYIRGMYQQLGLSDIDSAIRLASITIYQLQKYKNDIKYKTLLNKVAKNLFDKKSMTYKEVKNILDDSII